MSKQQSFLPAAQPSTWLGVMDRGQLGRMFAQAAQSMGYKVAERLIEAGYTDPAGLEALASQCAAVTTEFENVPADSLGKLAEKVFVAPNAHGVSVAQDRIAEK